MNRRRAPRTARAAFVDPYDKVRATGSLILIDETTNQTVAAGLIQ
jgi:sulfate adenylyltransferase subunit 1